MDRATLEYMEDAKLGVTDRAALEYTDEQGLEKSSVILRRCLCLPCSDLYPPGVDSTSKYLKGGGGSWDNRPHNWSRLPEPLCRGGAVGRGDRCIRIALKKRATLGHSALEV